MVFPEIADKATQELGHLIARNAARQGARVHFARLTSLQRDRLIYAPEPKAHDAEFELADVDEEVLDWRFPVHVLDTFEVMARKGALFERLRQRLRKVDRSRITSISLDSQKHHCAVAALLTEWANDYGHAEYSTEDIVAPVLRLLEMHSQFWDGIRGQLVTLDGEPAAFGLWETPVFPGGPANELASVATRRFPGLSEWRTVLLCEELCTLGISRLNVGGSETHGLDRYKRKFGPCNSIPLTTVALIKKR